MAKRNGHVEFAQDIKRGLTSNPKHLFPKYLYDELGSRLFEAICEVDEYYLTRSEDEILTTHADEIVAAIPECETLIELGSGSAEKTRKIIEALIRQRGELLFVPIDISASALKESSHALLDSYPELRINAYAADYFQALDALKPGKRPTRSGPVSRIEHRKFRARRSAEFHAGHPPRAANGRRTAPGSRPKEGSRDAGSCLQRFARSDAVFHRERA